jgi:hypothetical protein
MSSVKQEVEALLKNLPDNCTYEDVQYHLYVVEKIKKGLDRADKEGTFTQQEAINKFQ